MTPLQNLATALQRVEAVLRRRPEMGLQDDAPATARWESGLRFVASHANGTQLVTDMPAELGGSGDQVTPGWLFRAGLASCAATCIVLAAAAEGIALATLEVSASRLSPWMMRLSRLLAGAPSGARKLLTVFSTRNGTSWWWLTTLSFPTQCSVGMFFCLFGP